MCGIIGLIAPENVGPLVVRGLQTLEYRGYDSWGVALLSKSMGTPWRHRRVGNVGKPQTRQWPVSQFGIGHTRWATHGGITVENAHPHVDSTGRFALVHNGIIENYAELKFRLEKQGIRFLSQTDSEVAVELLAYYGRKLELREAVRRMVDATAGLNSFVILDSVTKQIVAAQDGLPLVVGMGDGYRLVSSDALTLVPYTKEIMVMPQASVAILSKDNIQLFSRVDDQELNFVPTNFEWVPHEVDKGEFAHWFMKEIAEQPETLRRFEFAGKPERTQLANMIQKARQVVLLGSGTSAHAAMFGQQLLAPHSKRPPLVLPASEADTELLSSLDNKDLVIALSQSGETADILSIVRPLHARGVPIASLLNRRGSSLEMLSDYVVPLMAGAEIAVLATKSFSAQVAILALVAKQLALGGKERYVNLRAATDSMSESLEKAFQLRLQPVVDMLRKAKYVPVIGRGLGWPAALEIALKLKEGAYVQAEGFAGGELKHGPLALIQPGTPCLVVDCDERKRSDLLSNAAEVRARGGIIIGIGPEEAKVFDLWLPLLQAGPFTALTANTIGQVLTYLLAVQKKINPDRPRNLAKSVTVK